MYFFFQEHYQFSTILVYQDARRQMVKLRNQKCRLLKKHHTLHININLMQRIFNALLKFLFLGTIYTVFKM